ncbi:cellulase family glycosylhydrolase [bacterium AH-315-K20]|nr:cellulase family glycosylhydrolase [bacterium AH-315-K20]
MQTDPNHFEHLESRVLLAAGSPDPITDDHPLWAVPQGAAVIDGILDDNEWGNAFSTTRTLAYNENIVATVSLMYSEQGLYMGVRVLDRYLWADGNGNGAGNRWNMEQDDSVLFYFDQDRSQDIYFQPEDRAFGFNIGNFDDPKSATEGPVRRYKFVQGDGAGGAPDVGFFGDDWNQIIQDGGDTDDYFLPTGAMFASTYQGTLNDDSDIDIGWTSEAFMPWSGLNMTTPAHGETIGMNWDVILDDTGGTRDTVNRRHSDARWEGIYVPDDHLTGSQSSYSSGQPGINGPVGYAEVMFVDTTANATVPAIADLTTANTTGYSSRLRFTAPAATTTGLGFVSEYQIRYSSNPIDSDRDWLNATVFANRYLPRGAGLAEDLRLIGLTPSTTYAVAIRPVDAAGNLGGVATTTITTQSTTQDISGGMRIVPAPLGRLLMTEAGEPFFAVGDHLGLSWAYTRQLFPGDVWDAANNIYQNFYENEPIEGPVSDYFDELEARGVNTMRVFIEQPSTQNPPGLPADPNGAYWLEHNVGQYNPDMRAFLDNVLEQADARGMYIVVSAFSTYYYPESVYTEGPWLTDFGGPLESHNDFFQEPATLQIAKDRMAEVTRWVKESPYASRVIGYEIINEWHAKRWTRNAEGEGFPDRAPEVIRRAQWIGELARYVKSIDPERLVINAPVLEEVRGAIARSTLYSRDFDMVMPHFYTLGNEEPINNPSTDRSVAPAIEQARLTASWMLQADDRRPILNGEWGLVRALWPSGETYYSDQTYVWGTPPATPSFTLAEDEALFSSVLWAGIATGQAGTPMRMGNEALNFITGVNRNGRSLKQGLLLTDNMRATQQLVALWHSTSSIGFDWATYSPDPLSGLVSVSSAAGYSLYAMGGSDGAQGVVYIHQDRDAKDGTVADARLSLAGLDKDSLYDIEIWSTDIGTTGPMAVLRNRFSPDGTLAFNIPAFDRSVVVRFRTNPLVGDFENIVAVKAGSKTVSFSLGLDEQPVATIFDSSTQTTTVVDIASLVGFRGRAVDLTSYTTTNGIVHLAFTDERRHLWVINGNLDTNTWTARDLTNGIGAPGLTGDLTVYQPTWGAVHIGGLDTRGNAVNYWWSPGRADWEFSDLTAILDGPTMSGGLTSWVAPWGALNLAGLNDAGEIVVYWWVPGGTWSNLNMTTQFDGPALEGQLAAFVTPWGAMNILGLNNAGNAVAYWWVPGAKGWNVSDLTAITLTSPFARGLSTTLSTDGGINVFGLDAADRLNVLRWTPNSGRWADTDITTSVAAPPVDFPVGAASAGGYMTVLARSTDDDARLLLHVLDLGDDVWSWQYGPGLGNGM